MKLPQLERTVQTWSKEQLDSWKSIASKLGGMAGGAGDGFKAKCDEIERAFYGRQFALLPELFGSRMGARALTWLWNSNDEFRKATLTPKILSLLLEKQQPRLTRLTLTQLGQVYFSFFDELGDEILASLQRALYEQVDKTPPPKVSFEGIEDPVTSLKRSPWLLEPNAAQDLVSRARGNGHELELVFSELGLKGYDKGRFGDVCRAIYYLETLKTIPLGQWDPVMDELIKSSVNRAPYKSGQWIGHAALEIVIDRVDGEASAPWQKFVLNIAGDPRLAHSAKRYQEWWRPLGEDRVSKVRGWLSREDLKLFLQAVEEYGNISGDEDLKRMFPARKKFLEGLYEQKMVRETRLMLGPRAKSIVQKILKDEIQVSFADLRAQLQDKAIIYLDCGDFYLVEGSHSFKLWVYLAKPGTIITDWGRTNFDHDDLTRVTPRQYAKMYDGLPYVDIIHNGTWQKKVFEFLGKHGIELDIEQLLGPNEYTRYLSRFGVPYVHSQRTEVPKAKLAEFGENAAAVRFREMGRKQEKVLGEHHFSSALSDNSGGDVVDPHTPKSATESAEGSKYAFDKYQTKSVNYVSPEDRLAKLGGIETSVVEYLAKHPGSPARYIGNTRGISTLLVNQLLIGNLKDFVTKEGQDNWRVKDIYGDLIKNGSGGTEKMEVDSDSIVDFDPTPQAKISNDIPNEETDTLSQLFELNDTEIAILDYLALHPGSAARNLLGIGDLFLSDVYGLLYGSLSKFITKNGEDSWNVKLEYAELLD